MCRDSQSALSLAASEASTLGSKEQGCGSSGNARSTPTPERSSQSIGRECHAMRMLDDYAPKEGNGPSGLTSSAEGSPARTSAPQGSEQGSEESGADSSSRSSGLLAFFDRDTCSWRTWQRSLYGDLIQFSESWPYAGTMRNGIASARPASGRSIDAIGYSSLEYGTVLAHPENYRSESHRKGALTPGECARLNIWPTPKAQNAQAPCRHGQGGLGLQEAVLWQTPSCEDAKGRAYTYDQGDKGKPQASLVGQARMFPTPSSQEPGVSPERLVDKDGNPPEHWNQRFYDKETGRLCQKGLHQVVSLFPTPRGSEGGVGLCGGTGSRQMLDRLNEQGEITDSEHSAMQAGNGGQLNPTWVELLMGFQAGWTDISGGD